MTTRRNFVLRLIPATAIGVATLTSAAGPVPAKITETDPVGKQLGYLHNAAKVDKKKFPTWAANRDCANCILYQGKPTDAWAACAVVGGKLVNGKGWCSAWTKKA